MGQKPPFLFQKFVFPLLTLDEKETISVSGNFMMLSEVEYNVVKNLCFNASIAFCCFCEYFTIDAVWMKTSALRSFNMA